MEHIQRNDAGRRGEEKMSGRVLPLEVTIHVAKKGIYDENIDSRARERGTR